MQTQGRGSPSTKPIRRNRILLLVASSLIVLSACTPPSQTASTNDLAFDSNGRLVEIKEYNGYDEEEELPVLEDLTNVGQQREACLDDGTCIRLIDGGKIEESNDGRVTWTTVWNIEPTGPWHFQVTLPKSELIDVFDIVALPDQSAAVAVGQFGVITRSPDGQWSPTIAELRTLPMDLLAWTTFALAFLSMTAVLASRPHSQQRKARWSVALALPLVLCLIALLLGVDLVSLLVALPFAALAALAAAIVFAIAVMSTGHTPDYSRQSLPYVFGAGALVFVVLAAVYISWSRNLLGWNTAMALSAVAVVAIPVALAARDQQKHPLQLAHNHGDSVGARSTLDYLHDAGAPKD